MYGTYPPQEGNDPKLSSIMPVPAASSTSASQRPNNVSPSDIATTTAIMKHPPQLGKDPKLLKVCMNDTANLDYQHQEQEQLNEEPPSKESIANSLLSFKQASPARNGESNVKKLKTDSRTMLTNNISSTSSEAAAEPCMNNSNFWLQDEEERFLLGLRMYGWGQWKRIQPIVKTRTNKQIKSHAQKREKVNPEIKTKYTKGTCRRGRISSGTLANDAKILRSNGGDLMTAIACDDQHQFPPLEQMVKDVYQTNNGDGPNSRVRRYRHTPYHHSVYHPHSTKMVHSPGSMSIQGSVPEAGTTEQLSKGPCYTPGMEIYVRLSNGKWASDIIRTVDSSGPNHLYLLQYHGKNDIPSIPENLIMSKTSYEEMIGELEVRFGFPGYEKLNRVHPFQGGTPVYAQWMNRLDPDKHARWLSGTVNSCVKEDGLHRYHILFDNGQEARCLHESSVLHRLDYDLWNQLKK